GRRRRRGRARRRDRHRRARASARCIVVVLVERRAPLDAVPRPLLTPPRQIMPLPIAIFKRTPEDFVVDEIDAYPASGEGPHTFVRIRKRGLTTDAALTRLAAALSVDRRACGSAGLKDKDAVTTQRISFPGVDPSAAMALA